MKQASYSLQIALDTSAGEFLSEALRAMTELKWKQIESDDHELVARVGVNFWSWGEVVTVSVVGNKVSFHSRCWGTYQVVDWGKNRKNVYKLLDQMGLKTYTVIKN
ncbi:MAG TPA: hypothetical protein VD905_18360 [Flavobacteriales bacterium]|nr:hypothetical protein [Flavobacteriales bacterium]